MNISLAEMKNFDKQRRKKLRIYYIIALVLGVFSVLFLIFHMQIFGISAAVIGFFMLSIGAYKRQMWIRLYQNLVFMKKRRESALKDSKKGHPKSKKYDHLNLDKSE